MTNIRCGLSLSTPLLSAPLVGGIRFRSLITASQLWTPDGELVQTSEHPVPNNLWPIKSMRSGSALALLASNGACCTIDGTTLTCHDPLPYSNTAALAVSGVCPWHDGAQPPGGRGCAGGGKAIVWKLFRVCYSSNHCFALVLMWTRDCSCHLSFCSWNGPPSLWLDTMLPIFVDVFRGRRCGWRW